MSSKKTMLAAVVALVAFLGAIFATSSNAPAPEGDVGGPSNVQDSAVFTNGVGFGKTGYLMFDTNGTIGAGSNQASWRNTLGRTVYIDLAYLRTSGTASTTFRFGIATSTAATVNNYTAPFASLINNYRIATSSAATTTSSLARSMGEPLIPVASGEYVNIYFQQGYGQTNCTGAVCETATSTNRGFNVDWYLRGHYKP